MCVCVYVSAWAWVLVLVWVGGWALRQEEERPGVGDASPHAGSRQRGQAAPQAPRLALDGRCPAVQLDSTPLSSNAALPGKTIRPATLQALTFLVGQCLVHVAGQHAVVVEVVVVLALHLQK